MIATAPTPPPAVGLARRADAVAGLMALLASGPRLMILCQLADHGALSAGALGQAVGLSPSALSQHLARLRGEGLIAFTRTGATLHYRIADPRLLALMETLHRLYCTEEEGEVA